MDKMGITLIKKTNTFIKEQLNTMATPEYQVLQIDVQNFETPDFNLSENERLKEFSFFREPLVVTTKNKPCIYFFEIIKGDTEQIIKAYKQLKKQNKSALKKEINYKTTCLYVGKSNKTMLHRLKVHLGYKNTTENGLQILHWAKTLELELKLHVYSFPKEVAFLLPLYEAKFNKTYKPLIGYL